MQVVVPLQWIRRVLWIAWAVLVVGGFFAEAWRHVIGEQTAISRFFGLSCEQNAPTWYASSLLLLCALQLALIARAKSGARAAFVVHWWVLAAAFAFISLDESVTIHECASAWFDFGGMLYFGWVIPASAVVAVFGLSYLRFLVHLPRRTRGQFIAAGCLYVGGALGIELWLGYWTDLAGSDNFSYGLIDLIEESLELCGLTLFLNSLIEHLAAPSAQLQLVFSDQTSQPESNDTGPSSRVRMAC